MEQALTGPDRDENQTATAAMAAMGRLGVDLLQARTPQQLSVVLLEGGLSVLGGDTGAVTLIDPDDPDLLISYFSASFGEQVSTTYATLSRHAHLPAPQAVRTGRVVLVADEAECSAYSAELAQAARMSGAQAFACLPLLDGEQVIGVLSASWPTAQVFTPQRLELLEVLAAQCAQTLLRMLAADAARATAARVAAITESMAVGYLAMDRDWRITYVNTAGERVLGPRQTLLGGVIWELFPATVGTDFEAGYRRAKDTGEPVTFEAYYPAPLDAWFEVRATPQDDGVALYFLDITARISAEAARQVGADRLAALGAVALALTDADTLEDLVSAIAERGMPALGADGGSVSILGPDQPDLLRSYITASLGEHTRAAYSQMSLGDALPVPHAARTGQAVLLEDADQCAARFPQVLPANTATGCQAWACLPLRANGRVVGVLTAGWTAAREFSGKDAEQLGLLETLAAQCAQALVRLASRDAERAATDAARHAAAQQQVLVGAARELAEAHTEQQVLAVVAQGALHLLQAHGVGLFLREPGGAIRSLVTATFTEQLRADIAHLPAHSPLPVVDTALRGASHFLADLDATEAAFPGSQEIYTAAGTHASASVALRVDDRLLGALSIAVAAARPWSLAEQELVHAFAALTAQALDRIAARADEQQAAARTSAAYATLQQSLLTDPPEPDHAQVVVRYRPAAAAAQVGGDWYDAFLQPAGGSRRRTSPSADTPDGDGADGGLLPATSPALPAATVLVIGDVVGHDTTAAAAMGQVRGTLRAIAVDSGDGPAAVLAATDAALPALMVPTTATAVVARLEQTPEQRARGVTRLRWSSAGHLPPVVIEIDGTVTALASVDPDLLLGIWPESTRHESVVTLDRGATLLLYTDGLVERRGESLEVGLERLHTVLGELHTPSPKPFAPGEPDLDTLVDELLERMVGTQPDDDVALIAVRLHPQDVPRPPEAGPQRLPEHVAPEPEG